MLEVFVQCHCGVFLVCEGKWLPPSLSVHWSRTLWSLQYPTDELKVLLWHSKPWRSTQRQGRKSYSQGEKYVFLLKDVKPAVVELSDSSEIVLKNVRTRTITLEGVNLMLFQGLGWKARNFNHSNVTHLYRLRNECCNKYERVSETSPTTNADVHASLFVLV